MTEWNPVLAFYPRTRPSEYECAILHQVSDTSEDAIVYYPKSDQSRNVHLTWSERPVDLKECVESCTAFRIEVWVEKSHITKYIVSVNPTLFLQQLQTGCVLGGNHIISLIKSVWRQAHTHQRSIQTPLHNYEYDVFPDGCWNRDMILLPHQSTSLNYMLSVERHIIERGTFDYDAHIRLPETDHLIDLNYECFTKDVMTKMCRLRGAYLCDEANSGKTVVSLKLASIQSSHRVACNYFSRGTLIIVPLNLPGQWSDEIERFYSAGSYTLIKLVKTSDLKNIDMNKLLSADIVLTTLNFLKNTRINEMLMSFSGRKTQVKKSRALFRSISANNPDITMPILQIVHWHRIIVDEIHEVRDRDLRILKCLSATVVWGLTATPNLTLAEELNDMNFMLEDVDTSHPNLYREFIRNYVCGHTNIVSDLPDNHLQLVNMSHNEKTRKESALSVEKTEEEAIMLTSSFDDTVSFFTNRSELTDLILRPEEKKIEDGKIELVVKQKTMIVTAMIVASMWCLETIGMMPMSRSVLLKKMTTLMFNEQKQQINSFASVLELIEKNKRRKLFMEQALDILEKREEQCPICMDNVCSVVTKCGHTFCMKCISIHYNTCTKCPMCKHEGSKSDVYRMIEDDENSKMNAIRDLTNTINEPVIIFAQFKKVLKHLKLILIKDAKHNVHILEGTVAQRASILNEFKCKGGILLLCATDSFAGIRLPHVKYIIFSHALFGEYSKVRSIEMQAIGRTFQRGKKPAQVLSFVSAETQEEDIWRVNHPG